MIDQNFICIFIVIFFVSLDNDLEIESETSLFNNKNLISDKLLNNELANDDFSDLSHFIGVKTVSDESLKQSNPTIAEVLGIVPA
jgi:hypothetical protein